MFEHFQEGDQARFQLSQDETEEIVSIVDEIVEMEDLPEQLGKDQAAQLIRGASLVAFRAGCARQESVTDEKYVVLRIPVAKAAKMIEKLLEED